jgi:purine-binding chemotaxis protein CheW
VTLPLSNRARAKLLDDRGPVNEYLGVRLGTDAFAVPLASVREILVLPALTRVPRAPRDVMGILSVRGRLVTVLDPRPKLRIAADPPAKRSRVLLVPLPTGEVVGLYVDEVRSVHRFPSSEIEESGVVLGGTLAEHVLGIARFEGEMIVLLDIGPLLSQR